MVSLFSSFDSFLPPSPLFFLFFPTAFPPPPHTHTHSLTHTHMVVGRGSKVVPGGGWSHGLWSEEAEAHVGTVLGITPGEQTHSPIHPSSFQIKLPLQQPGFNPSSLASTPAAWLQSAEFADSLTLAPTACKSDGHATQSPTLLRSYPQQLKFASIYLLSHEICYTSFHLYLCVSLLQRFFKYLCIAAKVPEAIQLAKKALEDGKVLLPSLRLNTCLAKRINCRTWTGNMCVPVSYLFLSPSSVRALVLVVWWL